MGKYFDLKAVLDILLLQITNKPNIISPYLFNLASSTLTLPRDTSAVYKQIIICTFTLHLMQGDLFKTYKIWHH